MKLLIDMQGAQTESRLRGIGRQARMLAKTIIAHGGAHDISILLNSGLTGNLEELRREFLQVLPPSNIKVFDIPGPVAESSVDNMWRMRSAELMREALLGNLNPDIVHLSSLFEGINDDAVVSVGLLQSRFATAVTLFDLIPLLDPPRYLSAPTAQRFYYRRAQSLKRADLLLAISESARREAIEMLSIPADRVEVALLAAGEEFHATAMTPAERAVLRMRYGLSASFILYVGAIEARKNVSIIIEAFSRLPSALQDANTIVIGGRILPPERLQLRSAACRFGVDPGKIVFPGFIAEGDLARLYALCNVFVFPSMHEGFGLPPLEAMACGAAVLATRNSSLPEVMGRDDLLFGTFDAAELATKLARLLTDEEYAASIRAWGVERAAAFSWDATGRVAVDALERLHERKTHAPATHVPVTHVSVTQVPVGRRPRLAYFSPLPSDRSGVADFSAELLRELGCFYDIECVIDSVTMVTDSWITGNFVLRDVEFFHRHASAYDRVIYNIGNSVFHKHMFDLLEQHPGVVILHDFFMSGIHDWLGNTGRAPKEEFIRELYITHGLPALQVLANEGREATAQRFASNRLAFEESYGVIVHSQWAVTQAQELYGLTITEKLAKMPLLRGVTRPRDRAATRNRLSIGLTDFVVCSFGFLAETKLNDTLLAAWKISLAGANPSSCLVFVGELGEGAWAEAFQPALAAVGNAEVLGFVGPETYDDYLHAADLAVQLRTRSRGETSRAVLDCMAAGVALIINDHGTNAEFPEEAVLKLPDEVTVEELASAIDTLYADKAALARLGASGRDHITAHHHPAVVGQGVYDAVEVFYRRSAGAQQSRLLESLREVYAPVAPTEQDLNRIGEIVAASVPRVGLRRLLFDVTLLAESDGHTGIERVVRSILAQFLSTPPPGYRLEPVRIQDGELRFARNFIARRFAIPSNVLPDTVVDYDAGDLYLMLEWAADRLPAVTPWLQRFRLNGGRVVIGINDLLPMTMPSMFPPSIAPIAERWLEHVLLVADQLVCISRTVADEVLRIGNVLAEGRNGPIAVDWYHCAHNIAASVPTKGLPSGAASMLAGLKRRRTFLMVGTVEPRKGHLQALNAFKLLWDEGVNVGLVIVGKKGWMVDAVDKLVSVNPERATRLFWFRNVSDEFLTRLYTSCTALLAASEGEGFGLPLVEAAAHKLPVIARSLPVFREVAGDHASYFEGTEPEALAAALRTWLQAFGAGQAPGSAGMPILTWAESAGQLTAALGAKTHYGIVIGLRSRGP